MKARLYKINNIWTCVLPPQDLFYNEDISSEEYAKPYSLPIYRLEEIKEESKQNWNNNKWVEGNIRRYKKLIFLE